MRTVFLAERSMGGTAVLTGATVNRLRTLAREALDFMRASFEQTG